MVKGTTITTEQYAEYEELKSRYRRELIWASAGGIGSLRDDIDEPIRECVMALALLGCEPMWSCCGFDYEGQPMHKQHEYGRVGFLLTDSEATWGMVERFKASGVPFKEKWRFEGRVNDGVLSAAMWAEFEREGSWQDKDCIHYSELGITYTRYLLEFLLSLRSEFQSRVVLRDTNVVYKERFPHWQYPPKADWVIEAGDINEVNRLW